MLFHSNTDYNWDYNVWFRNLLLNTLTLLIILRKFSLRNIRYLLCSRASGCCLALSNNCSVRSPSWTSAMLISHAFRWDRINCPWGTVVFRGCTDCAKIFRMNKRAFNPIAFQGLDRGYPSFRDHQHWELKIEPVHSTVFTPPAVLNVFKESRVIFVRGQVTYVNLTTRWDHVIIRCSTRTKY